MRNLDGKKRRVKTEEGDKSTVLNNRLLPVVTGEDPSRQKTLSVAEAKRLIGHDTNHSEGLRLDDGGPHLSDER